MEGILNGDRKESGLMPSRKGFTLLEVALSLFILSLLIYMASSSFLHLAPKYRLLKATWEINSRLNYAKYKAILSGMAVRMKFHPAGYSLLKYDENQGTWHLEESGYLEGVIVEANNQPTFYPSGTVSNLASIFVWNSWGKYKITIAITGRIKTTKI